MIYVFGKRFWAVAMVTATLKIQSSGTVLRGFARHEPRRGSTVYREHGEGMF